MSKVSALLVVLLIFCALPAVAVAQGSGDFDRGGGTEPDGGGDTVSSGNTQNSSIAQGAQGGGDAVGGDGGGASGGDGNAGNQAGVIQQNAGGDANAEINQSQRFGDVDGDGDNDGRGHGDNNGNGHVRGHGGGVGGHGGGVGGVTLARTGFDAWVLALLGGVSLAGGLGLLAAQRRGRLSA